MKIFNHLLATGYVLHRMKSLNTHQPSKRWSQEEVMDEGIIAQKLSPVLRSKPASMIMCSFRLQIFQDSKEKGGNLTFFFSLLNYY